MQKSEFDVSVQLKDKTKKVTIEEGSSYEQLAQKLMLNPEEVLIFVDGVSVPSDEHVKPGNVRLVKIVSGG